MESVRRGPVKENRRLQQRMNYSEYLRRKVESLPKVFGPSQLGDESTRIMVARYKASANCAVAPMLRDPTCCGGISAMWEHSPEYYNVTVPIRGARESGVYYQNGVDPRSYDGVRDQKAGRAICGGVVTSGYIVRPCCPQESTAENPINLPKARALEGKVSCCGFLTAQRAPVDCFATTQPPNRMDTLYANNMPTGYIVPPAVPDCCGPITLPPPPVLDCLPACPDNE
jgi:hypothetical protein